MSESEFYTFFTGGLGLLIAAALLIAWQLWRIRVEEEEGAASALDGVSHELRINLQRFVAEIAQVHSNQEAGPDLLLPVRHPQIDGVNASLIRTNRNALAVIGNTYQELEARKMALRAALAQRRDPGNAIDDAMDATINGIATLYMWESHGGARPAEVGRVRSWDVRDWMKGHHFAQGALPGLYLRDEVVERLRAYGLHLTPRPLTHTAHEYYSMHYDRKADLNAPFWKRKSPEQKAEEERKKAEKAARKAEKQAEKDALKAEKDREKAEKEAAKEAEREAERASLAAAAAATAAAGAGAAADLLSDDTALEEDLDDFEAAVAGEAEAMDFDTAEEADTDEDMSDDELSDEEESDEDEADEVDAEEYEEDDSDEDYEEESDDEADEVDAEESDDDEDGEVDEDGAGDDEADEIDAEEGDEGLAVDYGEFGEEDEMEEEV
ncbi:MAG: hypothetical protein KDA53_03190 [Hyphomonas sp.]|nr:hypothetical protein [Hyphomonas sp.]